MRKFFIASGSMARAARGAVMATAVTLAASSTLVAGGCSTGGSNGDGTTRASAAPLIGDDGAITINSPNVQLNTYGVLAANVAAGATSLTVTNIADLTSVAFGALAAGDLILVAQMQGAAINGTDTVAFGALTALNGAGSYELVNVTSVAGNTINVDTTCGGLKNAYIAASHTQIIRVPQPTSLTINAGGSVVARPWDGQRGGIVALQVRDATTINGALDASGAGFRGGSIVGDNQSQNQATSIAIFRSQVAADGAEKGEGIAGYQASYDALGGRYGRGAAANGGGGGNSHNGGGGGGANAGALAAWTGQGVMSGADVGASSWKLDPDFIANGNALTTSSGGGRGGYTFSNTVQDPTAVPPGAAAWAGNDRREHGGLGGRPLDTGVTHLYLGGGGGAGDGNNGAAGGGGAGGGAVLLVSGTVGGAGVIRAVGAGGVTSPANANGDAPGGAGGGGVVLVEAKTLAGVAIDASGGVGGNQTQPGTTVEAEGPGGGGGGGFIAVSGGAVARVANGGAHGVTFALPLVVSFPANGATTGGAGSAAGVVPANGVPLCIGANLGVTVTDGVTAVDPGQTVTYTVVVSNAGPNAAAGTGVAEVASAGLTNIAWTCAATAGSSCGAASGTGALATTANVASGGSVTYTVTATVAAGATGTVSNAVTVTPPSGFTDPNAANNSATDTDTVNAAGSDVAVTLTPSTTTVAAGGALDYTVGVTNAGPGPATGVTVVQTLPAGSTFTSATGTGWSCVAVGVTVTCTLTGSIASGGSAPLTIHTTAPNTPGPATSTVTATSTSTDPSAGNNTKSTTVTVLGLDGGVDAGGGSADLVVTGSGAPDPVAPGGTLTYSIGVHDNGPDPAANATIVNTLPAGSTFTGSSGPGWTCTAVVLVVTCTHAGAIPANGDAPLTITATAPATPGTIVDGVSATSTTSDPTPGNNTITITTTDRVGGGDGGADGGDAGPNDGGKGDGGGGLDAGRDSGNGGCSTDTDCGDAQSGEVCDDGTHTCRTGCRAEGGNGCPTGQVCLGTGHDIGFCSVPTNDGGDDDGGNGDGGDGGNVNGDDDGSIEGGGFSCASAPRSTTAPDAPWTAIAGVALLASLRRRRARGARK